jgi:hypothetical protein
MNTINTGRVNKNNADRARRLRRALATVTAIEPWLYLVITIASGYYTYQGARIFEIEKNFADYAIDIFGISIFLHILIFSFSVTCVLFYLMFSTGRIMANLAGRRLTVSLFVWVFALVAVVGISSYFNLAGLIGRLAVGVELEAQVKHLREVKESQADRLGQQLTYADRMKVMADHYSVLATNEIERGANTGAGRRGLVSDYYQTISALANNRLQNSHVSDYRRNLVNWDKAVSELDKVAITLSSDSINKITLDFSTKANALRTQLREASVPDFLSDLADVIQKAADGRPAVVGDPPSEPDAAKRRTQATAIAAKTPNVIPGQVMAIWDAVDDLRRQATQLTQIKNGAFEKPDFGGPFSRITAFEALRRNWSYFIPFVLAAVLLDTAVFPIMFLKMLGYSQLVRYEEGLDDLEFMSAADFVRVMRAASDVGLESRKPPGQPNAPPNSDPPAGGPDDDPPPKDEPT